jgi:hypothetical protein
MLYCHAQASFQSFADQKHKPENKPASACPESEASGEAKERRPK